MDQYSMTRNPHLASILQNLAQFTQPAAQNQVAVRDNAIQIPRHVENNVLAAAQSTGPQLAPPTQDPRRRPTTPQPDSSRITEWPPAVKYVMNTLSQNPEASSKIKRLIKNQHDNERQWWTGREALVAKHRDREASKKKADDLLRSLGVARAPTVNTPSSTAEEEKAELERYDKKVYAALGQMVAAMDKELTSLRVPFFAIKHELVKKSEGTAEGELGKGELVELQKKMLQFLQDLFGD